MNLYPHADIPGRPAVIASAEMLLATLYTLNAAEAADGTTPEYRPFAVQVPGSAFQHTSDALDALFRMLATVDGFDPDQADRVVDIARNTMHDLIGESDPARRAYRHATAEVLAEAFR